MTKFLRKEHNRTSYRRSVGIESKTISLGNVQGSTAEDYLDSMYESGEAMTLGRYQDVGNAPVEKKWRKQRK
jgi:hypothetical protein